MNNMAKLANYSGGLKKLNQSLRKVKARINKSASPIAKRKLQAEVSRLMKAKNTEKKGTRTPKANAKAKKEPQKV